MRSSTELSMWGEFVIPVWDGRSRIEKGCPENETTFFKELQSLFSLDLILSLIEHRSGSCNNTCDVS